MNKYNVLFYSDRCHACKDLISIMKSKNMFDYFKPVCVDGMLSKLPKEITMVPTIIVAGEPKPFASAEAFRWVKETNLMLNRKPAELDVKGFSRLETGFSDKYTYKDKDELFEKNYVSATDNGKQSILTVPEQETLDRYKQTSLIKDLQRNREQQTIEIKKELRDSWN